jgi:hypothetical protein
MDETAATDPGTLFRSVNERIRELAGAAAGTAYDFVCECLDGHCFSMVMLSVAEFDSIRDDPQVFVIRPGHEDHDVDAVVGRSDCYTLVRRRTDLND